MRNHETGLLDDLVAVEDEIEIECPRRVLGRACSSEAVFHREQRVEERTGRERRCTDGGRVQIAGLGRGNSNGSGVVKGRGAQVWNKRPQEVERRNEGGLPVTEIGAEGDGNGNAARVSRRSSG